jgi:hypothetical protein
MKNRILFKLKPNIKIYFLSKRMTKSFIYICIPLTFLFGYTTHLNAQQSVTLTYATAGTFNFNSNGMSQAKVEAWGAGGRGGNAEYASSRGGGGGGAYSIISNFTLSADNYTIVVGAGGGTGGSINGGNSSFGTMIANGGAGNNNVAAGAAGGTASTGYTSYRGGYGAGNSGGIADRIGGGGGASAGPDGSGLYNNGTTVNQAGAETTDSNAGAGGNGARAIVFGGGDDNAQPGDFPGGGGGGGAYTLAANYSTPGNGAGGQVKVTFTPPVPNVEVIATQAYFCYGSTAVLQISNPSNIAQYEWKQQIGETVKDIGTGESIEVSETADYYVIATYNFNTTNYPGASFSTSSITTTSDTTFLRSVPHLFLLDDVTVCSSNVPLNLISVIDSVFPENINVSFYSDSTALNLLPNPESIQNIVSDTVFYAMASISDPIVCVGEIIPIPISFTAEVSVTTQDINLCEGETTANLMDAIVSTIPPRDNVISYSFYRDIGGTIPVHDSTAVTITEDETTFYVRLSFITGCKSDFEAFKVIINSLPDITVSTDTLSACEETAVNLEDAVISYPNNSSLFFYSDNVGNDAIMNPTAVIVTSDTTFYVRSTDNTTNCSGLLEPIQVKIDSFPKITINEDFAVCCPGVAFNLTTAVSSVDPPTATLTYYSETNGIYTEITTPEAMNGITTDTIFYVKATNIGTNCESDYVAIHTTTVTEVSVTTQDLYICSPETIDLSSTVVSTSENVVAFFYYSDSAATNLIANPESVYVLSDTTFYIQVRCRLGCYSEIKPFSILIVDKAIWHPEGNPSSVETEKLNWNDPRNWKDGKIPAACSDVYMPGNADYYPLLLDIHTNNCNDIYFLHGSSIGQPQNLTYNRAHVQLNYGLTDPANPQNTNPEEADSHLVYSAINSDGSLSRAVWHMLSMPLHSVVSGDFAFGGYPLSFMRKFDDTTPSSGIYSTGEWTALYGSFVEELQPTEGFILYLNSYQDKDMYKESGSGIDSTGFAERNYGIKELNGIIEFPYYENADMVAARRTQRTSGTNSSFNYIYDGATNPNYMEVNYLQDVFDRGSNDKAYRFIAEEYDADQNKWVFKETITHQTNDGGEPTEILVGNPYMSVIDFNAFYEDNSGMISPQYRLWTGNGFVTLSKPSSDSEWISNPAGALDQYISPMQSVFLLTQGVGNVILNFNVENIALPKLPGLNSRLRNAEVEKDILRIKATNDLYTSEALIAKRVNAEDGYRQGEDVYKLFSQKLNVPEIFTLADDYALEMNFIASNEITIPLGIKTNRLKITTLTLSGMQNYDSEMIEFIDMEDNNINVIDITNMQNFEYSFENQISGINNNRFFLRFSSTMNPVGEKELSKDNIYIGKCEKDICIISSPTNLIKEVIIYDVRGRILRHKTEINTSCYTMESNAYPGVMIIKVISEKGVNSRKITQ